GPVCHAAIFERFAEIVPAHHRGPRCAGRLGSPPVESDRGPGWMPGESKVRERAIRSTDSRGVGEEVIVAAKPRRTGPALTSIFFRIIDEMVQTWVSVDQHYSVARHVFIAQQTTAGNVEEQVGVGDNSQEF